MNEIEKTKHDGAVTALKERIGSFIFQIQNVWSDLKEGNKYKKLDVAIDDAQEILECMRETLAALQELEPENK